MSSYTCVFSPDRKYRYYWQDNQEGQNCLWIMLNPSTADETQTDPTVAKCVRFSNKWGYSTTSVANIYAMRSTEPKALYKDPNPTGPDNFPTIMKATSEADLIILAWGDHGLPTRGLQVANMILENHEAYVLKINASGQPCHPLYQPESLIPFQVEILGNILVEV